MYDQGLNPSTSSSSPNWESLLKIILEYELEIHLDHITNHGLQYIFRCIDAHAE